MDKNSTAETADSALQNQIVLQAMSRKIRNLLLSPDLYNGNICQKDCSIALPLVPSAEVLLESSLRNCSRGE